MSQIIKSDLNRMRTNVITVIVCYYDADEFNLCNEENLGKRNRNEIRYIIANAHVV